VQFSPFVNFADVQDVRENGMKSSRSIMSKVTHYRKRHLEENFRGFEREIVRR
jgi:hypothetical protein